MKEEQCNKLTKSDTNYELKTMWEYIKDINNKIETIEIK